jgi:hypothetical protein
MNTCVAPSLLNAVRRMRPALAWMRAMEAPSNAPPGWRLSPGAGAAREASVHEAHARQPASTSVGVASGRRRAGKPWRQAFPPPPDRAQPSWRKISVGFARARSLVLSRFAAFTTGMPEVSMRLHGAWRGLASSCSASTPRQRTRGFSDAPRAPDRATGPGGGTDILTRVAQKLGATSQADVVVRIGPARPRCRHGYAARRRPDGASRRRYLPTW